MVQKLGYRCKFFEYRTSKTELRKKPEVKGKDFDEYSFPTLIYHALSIRRDSIFSSIIQWKDEKMLFCRYSLTFFTCEIGNVVFSVSLKRKVVWSLRRSHVKENKIGTFSRVIHTQQLILQTIFHACMYS